MAKFSEMRAIAQWTIIIGVAVVLTGGHVHVRVQGHGRSEPQRTCKYWRTRTRRSISCKPYETKLPDLLAQIESLKQQMEIQKKIVPDEKEADKFIHLMQDTAAGVGR